MITTNNVTVVTYELLLTNIENGKVKAVERPLINKLLETAAALIPQQEYEQHLAGTRTLTHLLFVTKHLNLVLVFSICQFF